MSGEVGSKLESSSTLRTGATHVDPMTQMPDISLGFPTPRREKWKEPPQKSMGLGSIFVFSLEVSGAFFRFQNVSFGFGSLGLTWFFPWDF